MGKYKRLELRERRKIEKLYKAGSRVEDIAPQVGVSASTVWRELNRGCTGVYDDLTHRPEYSAELAEKAVQEAVRRRGRRRTAQISE